MLITIRSKKIETYENETIDDLKKTIVHEFVHICHNQFCNYTFVKDEFIKEGIATFLANQYEDAQLTEDIGEIINGKFVSYNNYRYIFNILMKNCNLEEIRKILMGDKTVIKLKLNKIMK